MVRARGIHKAKRLDHVHLQISVLVKRHYLLKMIKKNVELVAFKNDGAAYFEAISFDRIEKEEEKAHFFFDFACLVSL